MTILKQSDSTVKLRYLAFDIKSINESLVLSYCYKQRLSNYLEVYTIPLCNLVFICDVKRIKV